ncbi:MAG: hypothetical protein AAF449_22775 [Myxococcota bacterium]
MTPEDFAPLADLSERMLLSDLATLSALREELTAAEAEIAALRARAAREIDMLKGADPAQQQVAAKWQAQAERRMRALIQRKAEIAKEEDRARASALEAFGRDRAVALLTDRARQTRHARQRRRAEQDGMPF